MSGLDNTSYTVRTVATTGATLSNQDSVLVLTSGSAKAVALQGGSQVQPGRTYTVVNAGASSATLTPATGLINGGATYVLVTTAMATIVSDGTNWVVMSFSAGPLA